MVESACKGVGANSCLEGTAMGPLLHQISRRRALLVLLSIVVALSTGGAARSQEPSPAERQKEEARLRDQWRRYGRNFVAVDGKCYRLPKGLDELAAGAKANSIFRQISVGEYACIFNFRVVQVMDESNMLVTDIQYSDNFGGYSPAIVRLTGMSTSLFSDGARYDCRTDFAIISRWSYTTVLGAKKVAFLAVPLSRVARGLSFEDFEKLVASGETDLGPDRYGLTELTESQVRKQIQYEREKRQKQIVLTLKKNEQEKVRAAKAAEERAANKLKLAEALRTEGRIDSAKRFLREIIQEYPDTKAARDAKAILDELGK
jgi:hypothetical protein